MRIESTMWPIMTLTLLLQLTDDEQLFAQRVESAIHQPVPEQIAPGVPTDTSPAALWSEATDSAC